MSEIEVVPKWVIYGLVDPRIEDEMMRVRYVGKTGDLKVRYHDHLTYNVKKKTHTGFWLSKMKRENCVPELITLQTGKGYFNWVEAEQYWIAYFPNLTNSTRGGEGVPLIGEAAVLYKIKQREGTKRLWANKDFVEKQRMLTGQRNKRLWKDPDYRKMQVENARRHKSTPEYKEQFSKQSKKFWSDPINKEKTIQKIKEGQTPEIRQEQRVRVNVQWEAVWESGCTNLTQHKKIKEAGCDFLEEYNKVREAGCNTLEQYEEVKKAGCETLQEYKEFMETFKK